MIVSIDKLKMNTENPREISASKLKQLKDSIKKFPEMLKIRPIVVDTDFNIIGGNMRYKALLELGYDEVEVIVFDNKDKQYEFLIKDNLSYGDWSWVNIAEDYKFDELSEWGIEPPVWYKNLTETKQEVDYENMEGGSNKKEKPTSNTKAVYLFYKMDDKLEILKLINDYDKNLTKEEVFMKIITDFI